MSASEAAPDVPANRAPVVRAVQLAPMTLIPGMELQACVEAVDPDGDEVRLEYEWERNGEVLLGEWSETLATEGFRKGDSLRVTVTPFDGKTRGESFSSESAFIGNRPPEILSLPPHELRDGKFIYPVEAIDPDDDRLSFALEKAPPDMVINKETGSIEWSVSSEIRVDFPVKITVTDGEETLFQEFTITVSPN